MLLGAASDEFNGGYTRELSADTDWAGFTSSILSMRQRGGLLDNPAFSPWVDYQGECLLQDGALGLGDDPYQGFLEWENHVIAQYNVWHEDRTAAGSGIEARVPFLDHRLVELVTQVPPALRPQLLWDKQILRDAMSGILPLEFIHRPKTAFFYGPGTAHVYRRFAEMLYQDNAVLVREALDQPVASTMLRADAVFAMLGRSLGSASGELELLLRLVNIGLLEAMIADLPPARVDQPAARVPERYVVADWEHAARELSGLFGLSPTFDLSKPIELADGVLLAESVRDPGTLLVLVDGAIEYLIDDAPGWARLLKAADGKTSLQDLLSSTGTQLADVEEMLAESMTAGLIIIPDPSASSASADAQELSVLTLEDA
jgi:asparagine synthase (glutamine-hydrolysing)